MLKGILLTALLVVCGAARAFDAAPLLPWVTAGDAVQPFTITFVSGAFPAALILNSDYYTGPANPTLAEYDAGDGTWKKYTSNTITRVGSYIAFRGDWRTAAGTYRGMFRQSFQTTAYKCSASGAFTFYPSHANAYEQMFSYSYALTAMEDNPVPALIGAPAANMYRGMFLGIRLVNKPDLLPNLSNLAGPPAADMCRYMFQNSTLSSGDLFIPASVGLTNENVGDMLFAAFQGCASWTGYVFWGTNLITDVITPSTDIGTFAGCTSKPNYETLHENWK